MFGRAHGREPAVAGQLGVAGAGPDGEVTVFGLIQRVGHSIDESIDGLGGEERLAQLVPPADHLLDEQRVVDERIPPRRDQERITSVEEVGGDQVLQVPLAGTFGMVISHVAEAEVIIPYRPGGDLASPAVAVFVIIAAQPVAVDVLAQLVDDIVVDKRGDVQVGGVAAGRVVGMVAVNGILEGPEIMTDIVFLRGCDTVGFGIDILIAGQQIIVGIGLVPAVEARFPGFFVYLEDIPAGEGVAGIVVIIHLLDGHAVLVALDLLREDVHPLVVTVEHQLAETGAGSIPSPFAGQVVGEHIAHEGAVVIRSIQHPVVFFGQAQQ